MDPELHLALRSAIALLLASAAWHKLRDLPRFREVLAQYQILPSTLLAAATPAVPAVEAALAAAIATGVQLQLAGAAAGALMLGYAGAIFVNVHRGRTGIDCGCTRPASGVPLGPRLVVRNVFLAAVAAMIAVPAGGRALTWIDWMAVAFSTVALSACWLAVERMLALAPRAAVLRRRMA